MIAADVRRRLKARGSREGDDVVLIDAVAADADGANPHAVLVQRRATGKDRDTVLERRLEIGRKDVSLLIHTKAQLVLKLAQWACGADVDADREELLREEANGARAQGVRVVTEEGGGPCLLNGHVKAEVGPV